MYDLGGIEMVLQMKLKLQSEILILQHKMMQFKVLDLGLGQNETREI